MSDTCYFCYWGWPKPIAEIYQRAYKDLEDLAETEHDDANWLEYENPYDVLHFSFGHLVWEDENWNQASWSHEEGINNPEKYKNLSIGQKAILLRSLCELHHINDNIKYCQAYQNCYSKGMGDPKDHPPEIEFVKTELIHGN